MSSISQFIPQWYLRHPDIQNIASSIGPRHWFLRNKIKAFEQHTQHLILDCGDNVRLAGDLNAQPQSKGLALLLHGWEGSSQSGYLLSLALTLYTQGYSVFRLNFRDHGDSHHLNKQPFNSTRLDEVVNALKAVVQRLPEQDNFLVGYSLGGNFALRIALLDETERFPLRHCVAVCPVIDPNLTIDRLAAARSFYQSYFVNKWRGSLLKKLDTSPEFNYRRDLLQFDDLAAMHDYFVPRFTPYPTRQAYFNDYTLDADALATLTTPTVIINSQDDPITRYDTIPTIKNHPFFSVELPKYGSHCAFLQNLKMDSWVDQRISNLFSDPA